MILIIDNRLEDDSFVRLIDFQRFSSRKRSARQAGTWNMDLDFRFIPLLWVFNAKFLFEEKNLAPSIFNFEKMFWVNKIYFWTNTGWKESKLTFCFFFTGVPWSSTVVRREKVEIGRMWSQMGTLQTHKGYHHLSSW